MDSVEDDRLRAGEADARAVEFIKASLPQELKGKFTDDDLYYAIDVLGEYIASLIDKAGESDEVEIDVEDAAKHIASQARKDGIGDFEADDLRWVMDAELDYGEAHP